MSDIAAVIDRIQRDFLWPPGSQPAAYFIQNLSGTAVTSITGSSSDDVIASTAHGLSDGDKIVFTAITNGTGLSTNTTYYIVNSTTNAFQVALTASGTALTFADFTAGTYYALAAMSSTARTVVVNTSMLSPEQEDLIGAGRYLEFESEWVLVESVSGTSPVFTLTVSRAHFGTTAASHADGTTLYLPTDDYISRLSVFTAVADTIEDLWPDLWSVGVEETFADTDPIELPAYSGGVLDLLVESSTYQWRQVGSWDELQNFPLSSTGNAIQVHGISLGTTIHVYYKKIPQRPTAESDTLADLYVDANWVQVIVLGAVAQLISRFDLSRFDVEFVTQAIEAEAGTPGEGSDIRNSILQLRGFLMEPLKRRLVHTQHDRVVIDASY